MFKRGPSAQILLLCIIGILSQANATPASSKSGQSQESRFVTSDEEPGILLPPDDKDNFVGQDDLVTTESIWRNGRNSQSSPFPPTTVHSTNSYSIRPSSPSNSGSSSSSYVVNAKPVPIITTGSSYTVKNQGDKYHPYLSKEGIKSTVFVKNNCFGHRCPPEQEANNRPGNFQNDDDDNKSYHYILNQGVKHNLNKYQRKLYNSADHPRPSRRNNDLDRDGGSGIMHEMSLSIPFRVDPTLSKYETSYPNKFNRRVLQTNPSSFPSTTPGWVKLQPIIPDRDQYDPFTLKSNKSQNKFRNKPNPNKINPPSSQFADRIGVELDPDSFAERWGWGDRDHHHGNKGGGSGSRFPGWLQAGGGDAVKGGNDRDAENRNWVKLEPIPVAGVTISKWVPKGTPNHELPSTNWPSRDPVHGSNSIGHSNPNQDPPPILPSNTKWWDIIDSINRLNQNRPQYGSPPASASYDDPPRGWSPNKNSSPSSGGQSLSSWERDRYPQNSWGDIIYPNSPNSATVSWQKDKQDMSKYGSSFSSTSSSPWQSDIRRPSSGTGSWSADRESYSGGGSYGGNRRQGSSSYPDKHTSEDDPRWVLISNSKKVSVTPVNPNRHPSSYPPSDSGQKYRPDFDKFSDFPFYEQPRPPYKNRRGKDYKDLVKVMNITVTKPGAQIDQDAAFSKVNATLSNLTPVLNKKRPFRAGPFSEDASNSNPSSSSSPLSMMPGFLKPYFGSGRASSNTEATTVVRPTPATSIGANTGRRGLKLNPVYAAVGAGMIPATMAAVVPMMLGRRRRDTRVIQRPLKSDDDNRFENFQYVPANSKFLTLAHPRRKRSLLLGHLHKAEPISTLHFPSSRQYLISMH